MKKIFILPFLILVSLLSMGQTVKHFSFDFNMNDYRTEQDSVGNTYILWNNLDYFLKSDTLLPALPYIGYNILIGSTEKYASHVNSGSKSLFRNNVTMAQNPKAIPTNMEPPTDEISLASYSSGTYPNEYVEFVGMTECDGYRILTFHVSPFEYDATAKKLYLRTHIDLNINLAHSPSTPLTSTGNSELVRNTIRQIIINPEDMDGQKVLAINSVSNNRKLIKQTGFKYVIVTSEKLKNTFQELANWKSRKGIRSKVLTVEHIDSTYTGATTKEKIKNALASISGLSYVLLGGDTLNVPTCMVYTGYNHNHASITPGDIYYSCMGTKNWDTNGNGLYGELDDNVMLFPSLNVSRAPVSSLEDAQVFVNRIINYESAPDTTNWKDNILMSGMSLGHPGRGHYTPYYIDGKSDTQLWSQMIYDQGVAPFWEGQCTHFYDTYTDISGDGSYDFIKSNLHNELKKGYTFVNVMTHGSERSWQMEDLDSYYDNTAETLKNSGYSVILTTACHTNAFDKRYCLSKSFINNPNSGILAYWGASREDFYLYSKIKFPPLEGGHLYNAMLYECLFNNNRYHRIGEAATTIKAKNMGKARTGSYYTNDRRIWMGINLMGDPEMPIYLSKPKTFENVNIQFINDSIYVDAGTSNFDICFINKCDSTDYYIARDIADSVVVFNRLNGIFDVCITKPDYVPYLTTCGDTYFQNKTLSGTNTFDVDHAMIGSDVTNRITHGPVVVNSEKTTIKANQGVTITKDFEVKSGAEFVIVNK